jgi:hypothetical protein
MRAAAFFLALIAVVLLAEGAFAAWPSARYKMPAGFGKHGDTRPLMKKLHKKNPPTKPSPVPDMYADKTSKSRSYHFKYGPIFPEHHTHIGPESESFYPPDHKLYY